MAAEQQAPTTSHADEDPAAEVARLQARIAEAEAALARAKRAAQRCAQLEQALEELKPRLCYRFDLPSDANLAIIRLLGKVRCRAAMACRGFKAAVASAKQLGAFKHQMTQNQVYTFGHGAYGELGLGDDNNSQHVPCKVDGLKIRTLSNVKMEAPDELLKQSDLPAAIVSIERCPAMPSPLPEAMPSPTSETKFCIMNGPECKKMPNWARFCPSCGQLQSFELD